MTTFLENPILYTVYYYLLQVLDNGRLVEFNKPEVLLSNKNSLLSQFAKQAGIIV